MTDRALEKIESGEASSAEAREIIAVLLTESSEKSQHQIYAAIGSWVWKALDSRRRDQELRAWFELIKRTSAALADRDRALSERLQALSDLIYTSILTSEIMTAEVVLKREHVRKILRILDKNDGRLTEKADLARQLNLKPANLSRILNMMMEARLIERTSYGKQALFCLSGDGIIEAQKLRSTAAAIAKRNSQASFLTDRIAKEQALLAASKNQTTDRPTPTSIREAWHTLHARVDEKVYGTRLRTARNGSVTVVTIRAGKTYEGSTHGNLRNTVRERKAQPLRELPETVNNPFKAAFAEEN